MNSDVPVVKENEVRCEAVDRATEISIQMNKLDQSLKGLKKQIREAARASYRGGDQTITVVGGKHKGKVTFMNDAATLNDDVSLTDAMRLQVLLGADTLSVTQGVKLRPGVTLRQVKEALGANFDTFFTDDFSVSINNGLLHDLKEEKKRMKTAHNESLIKDIDEKISFNEVTPRVSLKKT